MPPVELLSKPNCVSCVATERAFTNLGIPYVKVNIMTDPEALDRALELGYKSAPVVIAGDEHWSGLQMEKIEALASRYAA